MLRLGGDILGLAPCSPRRPSRPPDPAWAGWGGEPWRPGLHRSLASGRGTAVHRGLAGVPLPSLPPCGATGRQPPLCRFRPMGASPAPVAARARKPAAAVVPQAPAMGMCTSAPAGAHLEKDASHGPCPLWHAPPACVPQALRRHKLPAPHLALWPTEVHVVVRRKVCEKGCYFGGIYPPPGGNRQNEGMYVKYMPLFLFLATHKFSK